MIRIMKGTPNLWKRPIMLTSTPSLGFRNRMALMSDGGWGGGGAGRHLSSILREVSSSPSIIGHIPNGSRVTRQKHTEEEEEDERLSRLCKVSGTFTDSSPRHVEKLFFFLFGFCWDLCGPTFVFVKKESLMPRFLFIVYFELHAFMDEAGTKRKFGLRKTSMNRLGFIVQK
ncbi:hypothetical protein CEXT_737911 [Caerostris extrusa]|uniref:Uncharacterized protein n=1 Tax=Caerostris extrusa TaxID=172846 RepID=A0AAV4Y055_CAEEX|nr:hypothetical protein CEXT_737911 [Caerostris extrusa]